MEKVLDATSFRRACARYATGVAVAGVVDAEGRPHGITINSFTSVSLAPPLVLICIDHSSATLEHFRRCRHYGISVLGEEQAAVSNHFARRGEDRFEGIAWHPGVNGVPLLDSALMHMECQVRQVIEAGDHAVFLAEVVAAEVFPGTPLLYFDSGYRRIAGGAS